MFGESRDNQCDNRFHLFGEEPPTHDPFDISFFYKFYTAN